MLGEGTFPESPAPASGPGRQDPLGLPSGAEVASSGQTSIRIPACEVVVMTSQPGLLKMFAWLLVVRELSEAWPRSKDAMRYCFVPCYRFVLTFL